MSTAVKEKKTANNDGVSVNIAPPRMTRAPLRIRGTAPLVMHKFSQKARAEMKLRQTEPQNDTRSKKAKRKPRDFDDDFKQAQHVSTAGWHGIPCGAFRAAMIDACRAAGQVMTKAKMAIFVIADGLDADDGTPLVKLRAGKPESVEMAVRNETGVADIRIRPMWREWEADITLEFDEDMISAESVVNLLERAGRQVGVGEGRPYSKKSVGMGWGTFTVVSGKE
jgi:hypothetical protein